MSPNVLVLTPVKNSAHEAVGYVDRLSALTYPAQHLALGMLASDSTDGTSAVFAHEITRLTDAGWRSAQLWNRDFGYQIPDGVPRWEPSIQLDRRRVLALSRNHLLFNALTDDIEWVLWLDADVLEFQPDIIELMLSVQRDILQPHCVREWGGPTFDLNAWRDQGRLHLDDLRSEGFLAKLDAVGGTLLFVRDLTLDTSLRLALVDSRRRYKDFIDISTDFAFETGPDQRFTFVPPRGALGYSADGLMALEPAALMVGDHIVNGEVPFLARRRIESEEVWLRRADGR